jgi:hypothetical protein
VRARLARDVDRERVLAAAGTTAAALDDRELLVARLVVEFEHEEAVDEPARQPRGPDVVERVGGADDREPAPRLHVPEPRHLDVAVRQGGQQGVERAARRAVELLDVEHAAGAHRARERSRHEVLRPIALLEHHRRVEAADQRVGRQLFVAGGVDEVIVAVREMARERAHHRGLGHTRQAEQQHSLAAFERAEKQPQLCTSAHNLSPDRSGQLRRHSDPSLLEREPSCAKLAFSCTFAKVNL